jgi:hypothetical protein
VRHRVVDQRVAVQVLHAVAMNRPRSCASAPGAVERTRRSLRTMLAADGSVVVE